MCGVYKLCSVCICVRVCLCCIYSIHILRVFPQCHKFIIQFTAVGAELSLYSDMLEANVFDMQYDRLSFYLSMLEKMKGLFEF